MTVIILGEFSRTLWGTHTAFCQCPDAEHFPCNLEIESSSIKGQKGSHICSKCWQDSLRVKIKGERYSRRVNPHMLLRRKKL